MAQSWSERLRTLGQADAWVASAALVLMTVIPIVEILMRPMLGRGIENASVLVQHLGLVLTMLGALAAERNGHLTTLGGGTLPMGPHGEVKPTTWQAMAAGFANLSAALVCGLLTWASWRFAASEMDVSHDLAYGMPVWWVQFTMPLGFALLGAKLAARCSTNGWGKLVLAASTPALGIWVASAFDGTAVVLWPGAFLLAAALLAGAPVFSVLGGLALALFWQDGLPLAAIALSHYQITVNPSLPALPLFTLAGLVFARTGAAKRLGDVFVAMMGGGVTGTVLAAAVLCSFFTAFTGGSGVTILALGGLLLPLLRNAGYPEQRGISLVTSASALGVLLAPSVPLIMYAIIARVPINTMFLAGLIPAFVMVLALLVFGGYLKKSGVEAAAGAARPDLRQTLSTAWAAKWEILAPVVAIGSLVSGIATPTESAALTAAYAVLTQAFAHRELSLRMLGKWLSESAQIIGGVLLILGMSLALTNYLIDAGIPDAAIDAVQGVIPNKYGFMLALTVFLLFAGALMEIFAALVVLVPLLLPVAMSYGIDPVHFGIIFLAAMEMGFLCPPAGMNIYFASAMFGKPLRYVAKSVLPALLALVLGTLTIAWLPPLATGLPTFIGALTQKLH
ncbi:MAG: C4-dicarboxylate ABC transporter permease [Burkholderiales bacterium PBB4]|nr:MAG: C4-dicarboxylate ABC transporter permease [Burkholderiales bacterium PBB4]